MTPSVRLLLNLCLCCVLAAGQAPAWLHRSVCQHTGCLAVDCVTAGCVTAGCVTAGCDAVDCRAAACGGHVHDDASRRDVASDSDCCGHCQHAGVDNPGGSSKLGRVADLPHTATSMRPARGHHQAPHDHAACVVCQSLVAVGGWLLDVPAVVVHAPSVRTSGPVIDLFAIDSSLAIASPRGPPSV